QPLLSARALRVAQLAREFSCLLGAHAGAESVERAIQIAQGFLLRKASCGAHLETSSIQGTSVGLSAFSSRCSSSALRLLPLVRYASCFRCKPPWYAQRAAPACCLHAVICW